MPAMTHPFIMSWNPNCPQGTDHSRSVCPRVRSVFCKSVQTICKVIMSNCVLLQIDYCWQGIKFSQPVWNNNCSCQRLVVTVQYDIVFMVVMLLSSCPCFPPLALFREWGGQSARRWTSWLLHQESSTWQVNCTTSHAWQHMVQNTECLDPRPFIFMYRACFIDFFRFLFIQVYTKVIYLS